MTILRLQQFQAGQLQPFDAQFEHEMVGLSGASGAGKSVLLRAIADLTEHRGEAWLNGAACSSISPVTWRKRVGFLPAESAWWHDRVGQHFHTDCHDCLQALQLPADCMQWQVARCSTGEKQRLAIARLLQQQPEVLLLDEPTASLDVDSIKAVETLIRQYAEQHHAVVIWVSHDQAQLARLCQRRFQIEQQQVTAA